MIFAIRQRRTGKYKNPAIRRLKILELEHKVFYKEKKKNSINFIQYFQQALQNLLIFLVYLISVYCEITGLRSGSSGCGPRAGKTPPIYSRARLPQGAQGIFRQNASGCGKDS
jgi:hypothetical protein